MARSKLFAFRLTEAEFKALHARAAADGSTASAMLRALVYEYLESAPSDYQDSLPLGRGDADAA